MTAWVIATIGWASVLFYFAVARARLAEIHFMNDALKIALGMLDGEQTEEFVALLAILERADD